MAKMDVQIETQAHRPIIISITITQIGYFGVSQPNCWRISEYAH